MTSDFIRVQADAILGTLTLEEKVALCSGADFWHTKALPERGVPDAKMSDGPHGLRIQGEKDDMLGINDSLPATCYPTASLSACSFDCELLERMGEALGNEARAQGLSMVLGPGANIKRNPLCGRNFEYFSEDPLLSGELAAAEIRGIQKAGVAACVKHFALNNQEHKRFNSNSMADERTMREIYLASFERAVKGGHPRAVMCSYNKVNGQHASTNRALLTDILRDEWGFDGMVVTDWGALSDRVKAFEAGCDLCMPGGSAYGEVEACDSVRSGVLDEKHVTASARRVLEFALEAQENADAGAQSTLGNAQAQGYDLAREVAESSIVLLKNDGRMLPLSRYDRQILFVGDMAQNPRYQGAGSSHINPWRLASFISAAGNVEFVQGCSADGATSESQLSEIRERAAQASCVVVFAGLVDACESEGYDRANMEMTRGHLAMIKAATQANENVAVVLMCGSPVEVPWEESVKAIVYAGLSGEAGGEAIARVLFGEVNPSGKLAETWPLSYQDCPSSAIYGEKDAEYREGIYVGYRYYQKAGVPVRFAFGHGLSYTSFIYDALVVEQVDNRVKVRFALANTGERGGSEVAQVYVSWRGKGSYRPVRELAGFKKVQVEVGARKEVELELGPRCFSIWDDGWKQIGGTYVIEIGASSQDIRLSALVDVSGSQMPPACSRWYENPEGQPSAEDFTKLYGTPSVVEKPAKGSYTMDSTIAEMAKDSFFMKAVHAGMKAGMTALFALRGEADSPELDMFLSASTDCSLSALKVNAGMKGTVFEGMLDIANGKRKDGMRKMLAIGR